MELPATNSKFPPLCSTLDSQLSTYNSKPQALSYHLSSRLPTFQLSTTSPTAHLATLCPQLPNYHLSRVLPFSPQPNFQHSTITYQVSDVSFHFCSHLPAPQLPELSSRLSAPNSRRSAVIPPHPHPRFQSSTPSPMFSFKLSALGSQLSTLTPIAFRLQLSTRSVQLSPFSPQLPASSSRLSALSPRSTAPATELPALSPQCSMSSPRLQALRYQLFASRS